MRNRLLSPLSTASFALMLLIVTGRNGLTGATGATQLVAVPISQASPGSTLSPSDIASAIEQGATGHVLQASCTALAYNSAQERSGYFVVVAGPVGRIMAAAKSAADRGVPFAAANVSDALLAPVLTVTADSVAPLGVRVPSEIPTPTWPPDAISGIAIKSAGTKTEPPVTLTPIGRMPLIFTFDLSAFRALPDADIEIVLETRANQAGGYSCKIDSETRKTLR